ncbi:glutaredoxin 3 [Sporosalibacterium faouarense]|uniref:glutaredoxin 3 n=1 Tax=Sporosalibacterium faouarense TaxID=516123 RepID=UPI00141CF7B4|nr:glutaredoxin 3 [Sporosalibacterium faouarense]MTI48409.1 glutaredoxin 3 [Bacillota bacterium]
MAKKVVIYTFETCPFCKRAKRLLNNKGIDFKEIEISDDDAKLDELEQQTGCSTVPQIFVNDKFIGGCDDIIQLYKDGKFDEVFK